MLQVAHIHFVGVGKGKGGLFTHTEQILGELLVLAARDAVFLILA